jgi:hypothetical protein
VLDAVSRGVTPSSAQQTANKWRAAVFIPAAACVVCCRSSQLPQSAAPGRKLLASSGGGTGGGSSSAAGGHATASTSHWAGYHLATASRANHAVDEAGPAPEIGRFVGASPGSNRVIGGLFLHTTRKTSTRADCAGG